MMAMSEAFGGAGGFLLRMLFFQGCPAAMVEQHSVDQEN